MKLSLNNINKSFSNLEILRNLSFNFEAGHIYIIKGKNGAGKSTLLNILSGIDSKYSGELSIDNQVITSKNIISYSETYISYLTQDSIVFDDISCLNNILLPYSSKNKEKAILLLKEFELGNCIDENASNLSYGERQRLAFARSLYSIKPIILLDEITSNLDDKSRNLIIKKLVELSKNHIVIMVAHDEIPELTTDNCIFVNLKGGQLIANEHLSNREEANNESILLKNNPSFFNELINSIKLNKLSYAVYSIFITLFTCLSFIFGGFYNTYGENNKINITFQNYINSAPGLYVKRDSDIDLNQIDSTSIFSVINNNCLFITNKTDPNSKIVGVLAIQYGENFSDFGINLVKGNYPKNKNEIIVSKNAYDSYVSFVKENDDLTNDEASNQFFNLTDLGYSIVGVYEPEFYDNYELHYTATLNTAALSYNFMLNNGFTITDKSTRYDMIIRNNYDNRHKIKADQIIDPLLYWDSISSSSTPDSESRVELDANGKYPYSIIDKYNSWLILIYGTIGLTAIFAIIMIISFYNSNKRLFILLRVSGMSRKRQIKNSFICFSLLSIIDTVLGIGIGEGLGQLIALILKKSFNPCISIFNAYYLIPIISPIICLISIIIFYIVLAYFLSPKDLSKKLNEIKRK